MGQQMTLIEVVTLLAQQSDAETIYAAPPWRRDSAAIVAEELEDGGLPVEAQLHGMTYFLEVVVAKDFLEGWVQTRSTPPTVEEMCERLIGYAVHDA